jgi:prepilin-type N-terminal cleavage/methylation domain-containing protein
MEFKCSEGHLIGAFFQAYGKNRCIIVSQRKGFTLVELLVVIAIIALLMPALAYVRSQAKAVLCL